MGEARGGHRQADLQHGGLELFAVLGGGDGLGIGTDHLDAVGLEHAALGQGHRQVERRLAPEGGQEGVRALPLDDGRQHVGVEGLDVGAVGHPGVGHDRGRVGVHQDDAVALFLEGLAGLRARIVEFAGLADHNRT